MLSETALTEIINAVLNRGSVISPWGVGDFLENSLLRPSQAILAAASLAKSQPTSPYNLNIKLTTNSSLRPPQKTKKKISSLRPSSTPRSARCAHPNHPPTPHGEMSDWPPLIVPLTDQILRLSLSDCKPKRKILKFCLIIWCASAEVCSNCTLLGLQYCTVNGQSQKRIKNLKSLSNLTSAEPNFQIQVFTLPDYCSTISSIRML